MTWLSYARLSLCAAIAAALPAQTLTTLFSFDNTNGAYPTAPLVQGTDGKLYGSITQGAANAQGAIFATQTSGMYTLLYNFCAQTGCPDGSFPYSQLIQDRNGDFYGTTLYGGLPIGQGTIFKLTPGGVVTTLYSFCPQPTSSCQDGTLPNALVQAGNGDFYGTTGGGGAHGQGTVFKVTPSGVLTTMYSFCSQANCADGANPVAALVQAANGDLYGATASRGAHLFVGGTIFKVTPSGALTTVYRFCSQPKCADGRAPQAGLMQAANGDLYGTTAYGGAQDSGTVFKISPTGKLTTLYSFCAQSGCVDGERPYAPLIQATDGNVYGTTLFGGANGNGTIFSITPSGTLTTLYAFCSQSACADGGEPYAGLIQATDGNFYGPAYTGGSAQYYGSVFSFSTGLGPFVKPQPASGKAGVKIQILGTNLTGATSVSFNGTPASFEVVSASLITATVPADATSGKVQVVAPTATLTSYVTFRVLP